MILITKLQTIEGLTVFGDEADPAMFYVLPNQPTYRLDDSGKPVFKFIKYRSPLDRADGKKGGFLIFDAEFVVPPDKLANVQAALDVQIKGHGIQGPAKLGSINYTQGVSSLTLLDKSGAFVEKISSAGMPSLYGNNVSSFSAELTSDGATLLEQALQAKGGVASVIYDLAFIVKVPAIKGHVWFRADKFYSFYQTIDKTDDHWYNESSTLNATKREAFTSSDSGGVEFDFDWVLPDHDADTKLKDAIREWGWDILKDAVTRLTLSDPAANTDDGLPDGVYHVKRDFSTDKTASFDRYFRESDAVEWKVHPQGVLPNITTLPGVSWDDYAVTVDLDDPFFKTLRVNAFVNADFDKYGIFGVDLDITYNGAKLDPLGKDSAGVPLVGRFDSGDQRIRYEQYVANNVWKYTYRYKVHFKNDNRTYDSGPIDTDASTLTIDVGDLGVLSLRVVAGGIDWTIVGSVEVGLGYADPANGIAPISHIAHLTKASPEDPWTTLILKPRVQPIRYTLKFDMLDGSTYTTEERQTTADQLYVDDPFTTHVVHLRGLYDFANAVDEASIDLSYTDAANNVHLQSNFALNKANPFNDWTFTALNSDKGVVQYSGMVRRKDGTSTPIPLTTAPSGTVYVGDGNVGLLTVSVLPDLIDWSVVKLVTVDLSYADPAHGVAQKTTLAVRSGMNPQPWTIPIRDQAVTDFTWSADFYLADAQNTRKTSAPVTTSDTQVVLRLPA